MEILTGSNVKPDPLISIIIPHYNSAEFISATLDSVFRQIYTDFEVVVVNDGSPDTELLRVALEPYADRIVFIDDPQNGGASVARNLGVKNSRGELLSFLDADDLWRETFLEELSGFIYEGKFDMVYADAEMYLEAQKRVSGDFLALNPDQGIVTREMLIAGKCHIFVASGSLMKRSVFNAAGGFDPNAKTEDFDLAMRLAFNGAKIGYFRKILFRYRIRPGSNSGDSVARLERNVIQWRKLQEKLEFTESEDRIVERHIANEEAGVLRAKGRLHLERGDWAESIRFFSDALLKATEIGLPLRHKIKLKAVLFLLKAWPSGLRYFYRLFRREELDFMPAADR